MKDQPLVSIGLPVYNGGVLLKDAIDSLLAQSFTDFELIISDNASTDQTEQVCRHYAEKDDRIRYYRHSENRGAAWNYNYALERSSGQYFKWAAHDDFCEPRYLEKCVETLERDPSIVLCHSKTVLVDQNGQRLAFDPHQDCFISPSGDTFRKHDQPEHLGSDQPPQRYQDVLLSVRWCFEIFGLVRAEALKATSGIGSYYGSDKVVLVELALMGRFASIPDELFFRRCRANQSTTLKTTKDRASWIAPPGSKYSFMSPRMKCLSSYTSAILKSELTASERLLCLAGLMQWLIKLDNWYRFSRELRREVWSARLGLLLGK